MADTDATKARKPRAARAAKPAGARTRKPTPNTAERVTDAPEAAAGLDAQLRSKAESIRAEATRKAGEIGDEVSKLAGQAGDRARELANEGKGKAAHGLEALAKAIEDSAGSVDDRLGKQYGDFARSAADTVAGLAGKLEQQDIDELVEATRDFVKKSPAVAIGSAAVVGFMLARLLRGSNRS